MARRARPTAPLLWRSYQGIVRNELFGPPSRDPKDPAYQFHLRYLEVLEDMKSAPQRVRRALSGTAWRIRPGSRRAPALERAETAIAAAKDPATRKKAEAAFDAEARKYLPAEARRRHQRAGGLTTTYRQKFGPIRTKTDKIVHELQTQPKIVAPRAGQASGDRLQATFKELAQPLWARESIEHFSNIGLRSVTPPPAFGDRKNQMDIVD